MEIKNRNLYTDMYALREKLWENPADETMENLGYQVGMSILNETVPEKIRYILFKLTNRCNSDCEYCVHAVHREPKEEKSSIPLQTMLSVIEEASHMGVEAITLSGGEPLVYDNILDVIKKAVSCKIVPVLLTNGILLPGMWEQLGEAGLKYIIISIDSVNKMTYKKQRGVELEKALSGLEAAIRMREKYKNVEIHVSAVLTKDNVDEFRELLEYMNERRVAVQVIPYHPRVGDADDFSLRDDEGMKEITSQLLKKKEEGYLLGNSTAYLQHLPDFFNGKIMPKDFSCKVGYVNLVVDAYMDVKPCWSSIYQAVGNLNESSLYEIWNGKEMQQYRRKMLHCNCEGCWYLCTSEPSLLINEVIEHLKNKQ